MDQVVKIYRLLRWAMLGAGLVAIFLLLKAPAPIAKPLDPAQVKQNAHNFQQKLAELESAQSLGGMMDKEVSFTAPEVNAALEQAAPPQPAPSASPASSKAEPVAAGQVPIASTGVSFEGDVVKGQFRAQIYGKDVYITVAGHLGSRDGYATFDPTEFKVGDLNVPVSLVNPALQRKLADPEDRDKLKLPDFVKGLRVENGELVITR